MPKNWQSAPLTIAALFLTMMCAGCESPSAYLPPPRPNLPAAHQDFGKPVPVPQPRAGLDARLLAKQRGAALEKANDRLEADAAFYRDVQDKFGAPAEPKAE